MRVVDFEIADQLLFLFFFKDSTYYTCYPFRHIKDKPISRDQVIAHVEGKASIGAPSTYNGLSKVIEVDMDILDKDAASKAIQVLDRSSIPAYASISGKKGYHIYIFLEESSLRAVQILSTKVKSILDTANVSYDKIYPSPNGKGGECIRLPLGFHPHTGNPCHLLDERMEQVEDALSFLCNIKPIHCDQGYCVEFETGEILDTKFPQTISRRSCINKLWQEGIQAPDTRHSATCTIANAIRICVHIPQNEKEKALIDWVTRTFPRIKAVGLIREQTDIYYAVQEAKRLWNDIYSKDYYGDSCSNQIFKVAMKSACEDEFNCQLRLNRNDIDIDLLRRLQVFNAPNAKPPGIGKTAMSIYLVMADIAQKYPGFEWRGLVAFSASNLQISELSNCTTRTVKMHKKRLINLGMVQKIPTNEIPQESLINIPIPYKPNFYALPKLTEEEVNKILVKLRDLGEG